MSPTWASTPTEIKYAIVEQLAPRDAWMLSQSSRETYAIAVPTLFKDVRLCHRLALQIFLTQVPHCYGRHVRHLSIRTESANGIESMRGFRTTPALITLLSRCPQIRSLELSLLGSPDKSIIPSFRALTRLRSLTIRNIGRESVSPLSERLVVSIAATIPNLNRLTLDRISRSVIHASDLLGTFTYLPLATGDEEIPSHPLLGSDLCLPSLLRLPNLRYLKIRDTHLGDPLWTSTPICCPIEVLDLGACYYETQDFNRICTERIIGRIGQTVDEFSVNTPLTVDGFEVLKARDNPLKRLRKVHLTPLIPLETVVETLSTLSASPIEELTVMCHEDDVDDMCERLEGFLALRHNRRQHFFAQLKEISLHTVGDDLENVTSGITFPAVIESDVKTLAPAEALRQLLPLLRWKKIAREVLRVSDYGSCNTATGNESLF